MNDLKFAFRRLLKNPGFTAVIVGALALAIGACVTMFSLINSVLLTTYGTNPERRVVIWQTRASGPTAPRVAPGNWLDMEAELKSFELLVAQRDDWTLTLTGEGEPLLVWAKWVSNSFFPFYQPRLALGRNFSRDEHVVGKGNVVILGYGFWQRVFGGSKDIVGRIVQLEGQPWTVIGVASADSHRSRNDADAFVPAIIEERWRTNRTVQVLNVRGLLKPGVTLAQAQAELDVLTARLAKQYPETNEGLATFVTQSTSISHATGAPCSGRFLALWFACS